MGIIKKSEQLNKELDRIERIDLKEWMKKHLNEEILNPHELDWDDLNNKANKKQLPNSQRKKLGIEIDPTKEPINCDVCGVETVELRVIPTDKGKGIEFIYYCKKCLMGK